MEFRLDDRGILLAYSYFQVSVVAYFLFVLGSSDKTYFLPLYFFSLFPNMKLPQRLHSKARPDLGPSAGKAEPFKEVDHIVKQVEDLLNYLQRRMAELK